MKTVNLSQDFSLEDYKRQNTARTLPLFSLDGKGKLRVLGDSDDDSSLADGKLIALVWPKVNAEGANESAYKSTQ